jgi:AcrR family transcriptional regulator
VSTRDPTLRRMAGLPVSRNGRSAIRTSLIEAAAETLADRLPYSATVRQIAARAGVNHRFVHECFGTKDALIEATIEALAAELLRPAESETDPLPELLSRLIEDPTFARLLTWSALDVPDDEPVPGELPELRTWIEREVARPSGARRLRNRSIAEAIRAMFLGWVILRRHTRQESLAEIDRDIGLIASSIVEANRIPEAPRSSGGSGVTGRRSLA